MQRISLPLFLITLFLASSCSGDVVYNKSADVYYKRWTPADTVFFDLYSVDSLTAHFNDCIDRNLSYHINLNLRYSNSYPFTTIPLHIVFDDKDMLVNPRLKRSKTWSQLLQEEFSVTNMQIAFADTGRYLIAIFPDTVLTDIYSIGVELEVVNLAQ